MAPKYKLTYFNMTGRAEPIRYIFAYAEQEYEDCRVSKEEWTALKPTVPFGKLPVLEVDGKATPQSSAISRYLAKQFGLLGKDDWEAFQADALVGALEDYKLSFRKGNQEEDQEKLAEIKKTQAAYLEKFDNIIAANPEALLVGCQVTWADLTFAASFSFVNERFPEALKPYPALSAFVERINTLPGIKVWLEKRPKDEPLPRGHLHRR